MKYTQAHHFTPIVEGPHTGLWLSRQSFRFYMNDDKTGPYIQVGDLAIANGADVPPPWLLASFLALPLIYLFGLNAGLISALMVAVLSGWLLPPVHAEYLASTFIHDIGLTKHRHLSRRTIDKMFFKAMRLTARLAKPAPGWRGRLAYVWRRTRPYVMFWGVVFFGVLKERHRYFKPNRAEQEQA